MLVKQTITFLPTRLSPGQEVYTVEREDLIEYRSRPIRAESQVIVCPWCARVWAKLSIGNEFYFRPVAGGCHNCGIGDVNNGHIPGSILIDNWGRLDVELLRVLPDELVIREFAYHMITFSDIEHNREETDGKYYFSNRLSYSYSGKQRFLEFSECQDPANFNPSGGKYLG